MFFLCGGNIFYYDAAVFSVLGKGDTHIALLSSQNMLGNDGEATVDGVHFSDLGFMRYAELLFPVIKQWMEE